ncbi:MAG TPA: PAS domain S-box protein, partial [Firmicutes bacterium]|nr:PAS domain S-box protein [Bacillota bacterium]
MENDGKRGSIDLISIARASFDAVPEGISILDRDLNILQVNRIMENWYSHALPLIGKKCYKAYQNRDVPCSPCPSLRAIRTGEPAVEEVPLVQGNGPAGWIELHAFPVKDDAGRVYGVIEYVRDITERIKILDELNISREWNRALAEDIPALVLRISNTDKIIYVNEATCSTVGEERENLIGRMYYKFIPEPQRSRVREYLSSLTPEQPNATTEMQINKRWLRWNSRAVFDSRGRLKEYLNIGEDITERREVQEKLRENEERNRALIGAIPDLLFRYNRDGVYLDAEIKDTSWLTEKGRRLYEKGLLVGRKIEDVLEPRIAALIREGIEQALAGGEIQVIEYSYLVGEQRHFFEARLTASGNNEVLSIVRDITDRRSVEEDLQYQLRFQKMVAEVSSGFVSMPVTEFDNRILLALKLSGLFFNADRCYIFRFSSDNLVMNVTHEWCAEGIESQKERNQDFPVANTPWWVEQMFSKDYVYVPDVEAMPPEAALDREDFRTEGIKSMLTLPMIKEGRVIGFLGLDAVRKKRHWTERQIALLRVVTEIIGAVIINYEMEEALRDSEERYREILATIEEGYYEADLAGNLTYVNEAACRHFGGYRREELIGKSYKEIYENPDEAFKVFHQVFLTGRPERGLIMRMIRRDGSVSFGEISISLIRDKQGYVTGFKGIGKDVTERIEHEKRLEYLSLHDQLTGIYNRAFFEAELERLDQSREYPITIISADLDGLKLVNDTLGHDAGDHLLKACAGVLQASLRQSDILSRVGGDEFAAILVRTDRDVGEEVIQRVR